MSACGVQRRGRRRAVVGRFGRDGEGAWESESLMQASNFSLESLDLVLIDFETLILMEINSCVRFPGYTMFEALSGGCFLWWTKHNSAGSIIVEIYSSLSIHLT